MRRRLYLFLNGILTMPSDTFAWTDRACRWIDANTSHKSEKYEYFSSAIFRRLFQSKRVSEVAEIIAQLSTMDIILVGHSNGCDIISRLLINYTLDIKEVHLIAGACERDFSKNGINKAMQDGRLQDCFVYGSKSDDALKLARNTGKFLRWFGLGYGTLGLEGALKVACKNRVHVLFRNTYRHSTWWDDERFDDTMRLITRGSV